MSIVHTMYRCQPENPGRAVCMLYRAVCPNTHHIQNTTNSHISAQVGNLHDRRTDQLDEHPCYTSLVISMNTLMHTQAEQPQQNV